MAALPPELRLPDADLGLRPIVDDELHSVLERGAGLRAGVAPLLVLVAALVAWVDPHPVRRAVVAGLALLAVAGAYRSARRARAHGLSNPAVVANFLVMTVLQLSLVVATGGLDSPALPIMLPMAIMGGMVLGRTPPLLVLLAIQELGLVVLAGAALLGSWSGLRLAVFDPGLPALPAELVTRAVVMGGLLIGGATLGTVVRSNLEHMVSVALEARERQLQGVLGHTRDLEALSGEIAHELKNPLTSIKGLGALLERDIPSGRAAERLAVMRGEIDRMQQIIDDFLTFSRPLSPLSLDLIDPSELCRHVASLHEADGLKRGVGLRVEGTGPELRGDHRKLSQVLVNLVQNALDASPAGSTVALRVVSDRGGEGVAFEVLDRGTGLPPDLDERVFEPGVSGKATGSGLGLTIALGLARQHGGELVLEDREDGGVIARLSLPTGGPP